MKEILKRFSINMDDERVEQALIKSKLPGRLEYMPPVLGDSTVILDGAHNEEKISATLSSISKAHTKGQNILVVGFLALKDAYKMIKLLSKWADVVFTTSPNVYGKKSLRAEDAAQIFRQHDMDAHIVPDPLDATRQAISMACSDDTVLITGSIYLAGEIRSLWLPLNEVLLQQTSWPQI